MFFSSETETLFAVYEIYLQFDKLKTNFAVCEIYFWVEKFYAVCETENN